MTSRNGFTLIELVVAVALLTLLFSVAALSAMSRDRPPTSDAWADRIQAGRAASIETGAAVLLGPDSASDGAAYLLLPDGRVVGDGVEALAGAWTP